MVGLVEHQHLDRVELGEPPAHQVDEAPGAGDQHVDSARERLDLRVLADAAVDQRDRQRQAGSVGPEALGDLRRELAGGHEHQTPDGVGSRRPARAGQVLQDRQRERRRLAGPRARAAQQVVAFEQRRNGLRLDRRRLGVARVVHGTLEGGKQS